MLIYKILNNNVVVIKENNQEKIVMGRGLHLKSMTLFPTKYAIGIVNNNGCEVLIHIALDTVQYKW